MNTTLQTRMELLVDYLKPQKIDVAIINAPKNVYYYSGFYSDPHERFMALVLDVRNGCNYLFVPALDFEEAEKSAIVEKIIPISDEENPYQVLKQTIGNKVNVIGLETKNITIYQQEQLQHFFAEYHYQNIGQFIADQRMRKSQEEITKVQKAIDVIENVLAEGLKKVRVGISEIELTAELEYLMRKFGADGPSFSTIVLSGEKSSLPHGRPDNRKIQQGDLLLIDMGVIMNGYCSDITRTFVVGKETEEQRNIYQIVQESVQAGIQAVKAGATAASVDIAARNVIVANGYGKYFNNRVGHGLGMEVHEEPSIHGKNEIQLEPGFLFTIEPGIYIPGFGGVRIEENVYVNSRGEAEVLTNFPTELIRIG
ncbi:M24 family metallopeptidase [Bacillus rubiinfantis]|uniref:M24 family metallopeptidase n=1 Tax=Bacillus rubiinfantis TaxID=1499680 RepID=UPI0005A73A44|nr:Xaa-Pro peptidase family protein [Bacillus rubiinfantis]